MENVIGMIRAEFLIVAVVLYFIGFGLKKIKWLKDNFIPIILGIIGMIICVIYLGVVEGFCWQSFTSGIVQGVLCAAASTYVNQIIKQIRKLNVVNDNVVDVIEDLVEKTEK